MTGADELQLPPGVPHVRVIGKVVQIMEAFTGESSDLTMADIIRKSGLPTTSVGRLVHNLVALHVLEQVDNKFRVGWTAVAWAASALQGGGLVEHARGVLRQLRDTTGETSFLVVRSGTSRMCIAVEEPAVPIRHTVEIGNRVPMRRGSTGWVFLAFDEYFAGLSMEQMAQYWPDVATEELEEVFKNVQLTRAAGYATSANLAGMGSAGITAPVFGGGSMLAAIGVTGPQQRVTTEIIDSTIRPLVLEMATELGKRLEFVPGRGRPTFQGDT